MKRKLQGSFLSLVLVSSLASATGTEGVGTSAVTVKEGDKGTVAAAVVPTNGTAPTSGNPASNPTSNPTNGTHHAPEVPPPAAPHAPDTTHPAAGTNPAPDLRTEQLKKIEADEKVEMAKAENARIFKHNDKKFINSILWRIMEIIESDRDGTSKMRIAALHLQELLNIHLHSKFELGSQEKLDALRKLETEVEIDRVGMKEKQKFKYAPADVTHELAKLVQDKFDTKIISLLKDYYIDEIGMMSLYGGKVEGILACGLFAGKSVTATGKRSPSVCVIPLTGLSGGVAVSAGHLYGKSKLKGEPIQVTTDKLGLKPEVLIAGKSISHETSPGSGLQMDEYALGVRLGATSVMKPFKLFKVPGRDFKYLRERLGLVPNP